MIDWQNCATGALERSHWAIRSAQILAVFDDGTRDISRISLRTGIETRAHLESTRKRALRLENADQAGVRSRWSCSCLRLMPQTIPGSQCRLRPKRDEKTRGHSPNFFMEAQISWIAKITDRNGMNRNRRFWRLCWRISSRPIRYATANLCV